MASRRKLRILVIDDDPDITSVISRGLVWDGHQVAVSFSMEDALVQFEHLNYDLVIIDIFMDGMGGIEGIKTIREIQVGAKIIAISGGFSDMSPEDALHAAGKIGADAVLPKPFELDKLGQTISLLLTGKENASG